MLTLTENAATVIKGLAAELNTDSAGLRIGMNDDSPNLIVEITDGPRPGDDVVEGSGARVFIDESTAEKLANKELDALVDESSARFSLRGQR